MPTLIALGVVILYPLFIVIDLSLHNVSMANFATGLSKFVGLENYHRLLLNEDFQSSLLKTLLFVVFALSLELTIGMAMALIFNKGFVGKRVFSTLLLMATMLTPIVIALMWRYMLNSEIGIINYMIRLVFGNAPAWLGSPLLSFITIVLIDVWWATPFVFLILIAGLAALPSEAFDAAKIDGASGLQTFRYVTLPMLRPVIMVLVLIRVMDGLKTFDVIYGLTGGGPGTATQLVNLYLYKYAFKRIDLSGAASAAVLLIIVIVILSYILFKFLTGEQKQFRIPFLKIFWKREKS
jgi:multiple sugar transport system permease protein